MTSYPDVIGMWTACYGETHGVVKPGQRYSLAQCNSLLTVRVAEVDTALRRCVGQPILPEVKGALWCPEPIISAPAPLAARHSCAN